MKCQICAHDVLKEAKRSRWTREEIERALRIASEAVLVSRYGSRCLDHYVWQEFMFWKIPTKVQR